MQEGCAKKTKTDFNSKNDEDFKKYRRRRHRTRLKAPANVIDLTHESEEEVYVHAYSLEPCK